MGKYILLAILVLIALWSAMNWKKLQGFFGMSVPRFFREVKVEMQKVAWPSRNEVIGSTIAVIFAILSLTIIIIAADQVLGWIMTLLLPATGQGGA